MEFSKNNSFIQIYRKYIKQTYVQNNHIHGKKVKLKRQE